MLTTDVLNINVETVEAIITKAREFHVKEETTFEEKISDSEYEYDLNQIFADHEDDLTYQELKNIIDSLDRDQKIDLLTLFYLGRGDFAETEWSKARKEARANLLPNLAQYLLAHPLVADFLSKGLEILGYNTVE